MKKYTNAFELISEEFKKVGIPCILIGGFAVNYYKVSRNTGDVDFILPDDTSAHGVEILEKFGYLADQSHETFVRLVNSKIYPERVDFMLVSRETFGKIFEKGNKVKIGGFEFVVPAIDHLIALKLHSIKNNPVREWKDLQDIIALIRINQMDVTTDEFKSLCLKFGTEELYNRIREFCQDL